MDRFTGDEPKPQKIKNTIPVQWTIHMQRRSSTKQNKDNH